MIVEALKVFVLQFLIATIVVIFSQDLLKASNKDVCKTLVIVGIVTMFTSILSVRFVG